MTKYQFKEFEGKTLKECVIDNFNEFFNSTISTLRNNMNDYDSSNEWYSGNGFTPASFKKRIDDYNKMKSLITDKELTDFILKFGNKFLSDTQGVLNLYLQVRCGEHGKPMNHEDALNTTKKYFHLF